MQSNPERYHPYIPTRDEVNADHSRLLSNHIPFYFDIPSGEHHLTAISWNLAETTSFHQFMSSEVTETEEEKSERFNRIATQLAAMVRHYQPTFITLQGINARMGNLNLYQAIVNEFNKRPNEGLPLPYDEVSVPTIGTDGITRPIVANAHQNLTFFNRNKVVPDLDGIEDARQLAYGPLEGLSTTFRTIATNSEDTIVKLRLLNANHSSHHLACQRDEELIEDYLTKKEDTLSIVSGIVGNFVAHDIAQDRLVATCVGAPEDENFRHQKAEAVGGCLFYTPADSPNTKPKIQDASIFHIHPITLEYAAGGAPNLLEPMIRQNREMTRLFPVISLDHRINDDRNISISVKDESTDKIVERNVNISEYEMGLRNDFVDNNSKNPNIYTKDIHVKRARNLLGQTGISVQLPQDLFKCLELSLPEGENQLDFNSRPDQRKGLPNYYKHIYTVSAFSENIPQLDKALTALHETLKFESDKTTGLRSDIIDLGNKIALLETTCAPRSLDACVNQDAINQLKLFYRHLFDRDPETGVTKDLLNSDTYKKLIKINCALADKLKDLSQPHMEVEEAKEFFTKADRDLDGKPPMARSTKTILAGLVGALVFGAAGLVIGALMTGGFGAIPGAIAGVLAGWTAVTTGAVTSAAVGATLFGLFGNRSALNNGIDYENKVKENKRTYEKVLDIEKEIQGAVCPALVVPKV